LLSGLGEAIYGAFGKQLNEPRLVSMHWRLEGSERFSTSDAGRRATVL
jgi:hypothetical protein